MPQNPPLNKATSELMVNIYAARNRLSELLQRTEAGENVILARSGTPVARLVPWRGTITGLGDPGSWTGKLRWCETFNRPFDGGQP